MLSIAGKAQQDAQFSQFLHNQLYWNPAYAGVQADWNEINLLHRTQWAGYDSNFEPAGAPQTQLLSINVPLNKYKVGVGLHLVNDQIGLFNNFEAQLSAAYHLKLNKGQLSIGARVGILNQRVNSDFWRVVDPSDPIYLSLINGGGMSDMTADIGFGVYYNTSKYFAGISSTHLQASELNYDAAFSIYPLKRHYYFIGGYRIQPNRLLTVTPAVLVKTETSALSIESMLYIDYDERYFGSISFREFEAGILMFGMGVTRNNRLRVSYSFDYTIGTEAQNAKANSSHEIMLTYRLPALISLGPRIIRTPRYRFD